MISYAQNQEDVILARVFAGRDRGTYVDVGAHFPVIDSVTEHFYRLGWRGLNIDPLPDAYAELQRVRVHDVNLNLAIAQIEGEAILYALDGYSTLRDELAAAHRDAGLAPKPVPTPVRPLSAVLADSNVLHIDFLKIDVEGAEGDVLRSNDWTRFRPSLVLVEAVDPVTHQPNHAEWEPTLLEAGYAPEHFDGVNRFYWNRRDLAPPDAACFLPPNALDGFTPYALIAADGRAAAASREAAYERHRAGTLLAAVQTGLERIARGEAAPPPDTTLEQAWNVLRSAIDGAGALRRAVRIALEALGCKKPVDHADGLAQALEDAALRTHEAANEAVLAVSTARSALGDAHKLVLLHTAENAQLRSMLAVSEKRRWALVESEATGAETADATAPIVSVAELPTARATTQAQTPTVLQASNIAPDARVFAKREDLLASFAELRPFTVAEIGVALSDFSQTIIETLRPKRFVAFDVFTMDRSPTHWDQSSAGILGDLTHREFFDRRLAALAADLDVVVEVNESRSTLPRYPDGAFDVMYIDAAHDFENLRSDINQAERLASPTGILIFSGYKIYDHFSSAQYGVVNVVNEMLGAGGWVVAGFALQQHMICDIALRRAQAPRSPSTIESGVSKEEVIMHFANTAAESGPCT